VTSQRARSLVLALGLALSAAFLHQAGQAYRTGVSGDYYQFWVVGQALSSMDLTNPYAPEARRQIGEEFWQRARGGEQGDYAKSARYRRDRLEPAGTPFLYTVFRAVSSGRYETDYQVFRWASLLAYVLGVAAIFRVLGASLPMAGLFVLATTEWFWPFRIEVAHANVNQLQVGALGAVALARSRLDERKGAALAGALLGLLLCFKPNLLYSVGLLFGFWALCGPTRVLSHAAAGAVAGAGLAFVSSAFFFGSPGCWADWLAASREILQSSDYAWRSLPGLLGVSPPGWAFWLAGVSLCIPVLLLASRGRPHASSDVRRELQMLALGGVVLVLTAPVVHVHYFVLCVPMLACAFASPSGWRLGKLGLRQAVAAVALLLMGGLFGAHFTLWPFAGAALLYGVGLTELATSEGST
jgi:hypothetical protein